VNRSRWRPGSRVERLRAGHSYGFVLLLIAIAFVFTATAPNDDWSWSVLILIQTATLIVALFTSGLGRWAIVPSVILAVVAILAAFANIAIEGEQTNGGIGVLGAVITVVTIAVIGSGVLDQREVNQQSVAGAVCIYLLIGMVFTFIYGAVATLGSGDFFAQGTDGTLSLRLYFSFVTLATLGYGDYTPAGDLGRTLAIAEALFGQLYLVTVIAMLVANMGRQRH
jgi:hypothetical protein